MDDDNVVIIKAHGSVNEDTTKVPKHIMNMFPGKVYIMTLAPFGGVNTVYVNMLMLQVFKIGGIDFMRELFDFVNRKPHSMKETIKFMESDIFRINYEYAFLIYYFIVNYYVISFRLQGRNIHETLSVYTKKHPPPNINLSYNKKAENISAKNTKNTYRIFEHKGSKQFNTNAVYRKAKTMGFKEYPEFDDLFIRDDITGDDIFERNEDPQSKTDKYMVFPVDNAFESNNVDNNDINPRTFNTLYDNRVPFGLYSTRMMNIDIFSHGFFLENTEEFKNPLYNLNIDNSPHYIQKYVKNGIEEQEFEIELGHFLRTYATLLKKNGYEGDTYIFVGSCKFLPRTETYMYESKKKLYTATNPIYRYVFPTIPATSTEVTRIRIPTEHMERIQSVHGKADVPTYEARASKINPMSSISSMYRPRPVDTSSFSRSFSRISSRRQHMRINTVTVNPEIIRESPQLLYILRKSMHHCFPSKYGNPDTDIVETYWNPEYDVVLFFTRMGGAQTVPRMFIEIEKVSDDTIKVVSMCSTHLAPLGVKKKAHFVKEAINTWISEITKSYNILIELEGDAMDPETINHLNKMTHIFSYKNDETIEIEKREDPSTNMIYITLKIRKI
jgi:hypothetical protein